MTHDHPDAGRPDVTPEMSTTSAVAVCTTDDSSAVAGNGAPDNPREQRDTIVNRVGVTAHRRLDLLAGRVP